MRRFCVLIGGALTSSRGSIQHEDDFRYTVDGVLMSIPAMRDYYRHDGRFSTRAAFLKKQAAARRQIYFSGLYMHSWLRRHGCDTALVNCFDPESPELGRLLAERPLAVVVSTSFLNLDDLREVVDYVRARDPEVPIIVGGRWVWESRLILDKMDQEPYRTPEVLDRYLFSTRRALTGITAYIVSPTGEPTLLKVLTHIGNGSDDWRELPNVAYEAGGHIVLNRSEEEPVQVDDLVIDWKDVPPECTSSVMPIALSLGCPFKCTFCNFSSRSYTRKSWDIVRRELREISTHQRFIQSLWFIDDTILLNESMATAFCHILIEEQVPFRWRAFIRADAITPKTAELFAASNCELLLVGMESMDDRLLKAMGKRTTSDVMVNAARILAEHGISAEFSFILGFPGEDERSVAALKEFVSTFRGSPSALYFLYLFQFHLFPLSPAFESEFRASHGLKGTYLNWSHATMDATGARQALRDVYAAANHGAFSQNYMDISPSGVTPALKQVSALREQVAQGLMSGAPVEALERRLADAVLAL